MPGPIYVDRRAFAVGGLHISVASAVESCLQIYALIWDHQVNVIRWDDFLYVSYLLTLCCAILIAADDERRRIRDQRQVGWRIRMGIYAAWTLCSVSWGESCVPLS